MTPDVRVDKTATPTEASAYGTRGVGSSSDDREGESGRERIVTVPGVTSDSIATGSSTEGEGRAGK
jgi:hypothetical protein